jgi:DNA-binding NarL/FixJ family response regulator
VGNAIPSGASSVYAVSAMADTRSDRFDSVDEMQDLSNNDSTGAATDRFKVLLVEDSGPVTDRIATLIGELGAVEIVGAVSTERAATEALARTPVDALVLDLHLKQGDGFGVLRFIRRQALNVAAVVFTSYDIPQYRRAAATLGAAEFLHKSRDHDKLGDALRRLAAARSRRA